MRVDNVAGNTEIRPEPYKQADHIDVSPPRYHHPQRRGERHPGRETRAQSQPTFARHPHQPASQGQAETARHVTRCRLTE